MGGGRRSKKRQKEEEKEKSAEDYCFVCKDGGLLIVCDHKDCLKSYHPECVGKKDSSDDAEDSWICRRHSCLICHKSPLIQCLCCPNAVCQRCIPKADIGRVRGKKGFCGDCLRLALLVEEGRDVDSDGGEVDFSDRDTYEFLFMEYWEIIRDKENIVLEELHSADAQIKKGENYKSRYSYKSRHPHKPQSDSDDYASADNDEVAPKDDHYTDDEEVEEPVSKNSRSKSQRKRQKGSNRIEFDGWASNDDHYTDDEEVEEPVSKNSRSKSQRKKQKGSNRIEFDGWASKPLIKFLSSIGVDTSKRLSQDNVASIISDYVRENKLLHPEKKRRIICDFRLQYLLGRKLVNCYKIHDLLEPHFPENLEHSLDEEQGNGSEDEDVTKHPKKQRSQTTPESFEKKVVLSEDSRKVDAVSEVSLSKFASVVPKNIKLVYLWRSLVEKLREQPESFESKVIGSFVRIKVESAGCRRSHQLQQVKGIKNFSADANNTDVLLILSNVADDVPISMLSNEDFSEEECKNLRQQVESGLVERPTVVELEKKAKSLHEDITKHGIAKELLFLKKRIDLANEKGWRVQLFEFLERRRKLQSPEEQSRLLREVPKVIADVIELKSTSEESLQVDSLGNLDAKKSDPAISSENPEK